MPPPDFRRITIALEALPDETPAVLRVRRALKVLLRAFKLRCTAIIQDEGHPVVPEPALDAAKHEPPF